MATAEPHTAAAAGADGGPPPPSAGSLTDEQRIAVERRSGELLLAAAAGSGKTAVLVERFSQAVLTDGVAPARILAITFTDRAAGELRERLRRRLLTLGARAAARDSEAAFVGTFHSFCARVLRSEPLAAGVAPDFDTLDEAQAGRLRARAFGAALPAVLGRVEAAVDLLAPYEAARLQEIVLKVYAELRSRGQRAPRLPSGAGQGDDGVAAQAVAVCALIGDLLAEFGERYGELKADRGALDFDDLELGALALFSEQAQIRDSWAERFQLLMVDEVQDVNHRQHALLEALERDNLFVVGDEVQSIYGFRHADVRLFAARRQRLQPVGAALQLTHNFRSRPEVIAAVNAIFVERFGERFTPLVAARPSDIADGAAGGESAGGSPAPGAAPVPVELLLSDRDRGSSAQSADGADGADGGAWPLSRVAEARLLAARLAELIGGGDVRARDVVVLLRAGTGLGAYAEALQAEGIATAQAIGGFWEQQPVCDLMAYLRTLANPLDEVALYGTLASPLVGLSNDALGLIALAARQASAGAWTAARALAAQMQSAAGAPAAADLRGAPLDVARWALAEDDRQRLAWFCGFLENERATESWRGVAGALQRAVVASRYGHAMAELGDDGRAAANVAKLLRIARRYERQDAGDLRGFLDHAAFARDKPGRPDPPAPVADERAEAVHLMTIHAAKGLEFGVVCVAELGARPNAELPDLLVDGERIGVRLVRLGQYESVAALSFDELAAERREAAEREEDRLLYVALTRARERLLLSGVVAFKRWPDVTEGCAPVNWLAPALVDDVARRVEQAREQAGMGAGVEVGVEAGVEAAERAGRQVGVGLTRGETVVGPAGTVRLILNPAVSGEAPGPAGLPVQPPASRGDRDPSDAGPVGVVGDPVAAPTGRPPRAADAVEQSTAPLAHVTYTALSELQRCAYRYYLEHVLRLPQPPHEHAADVVTGARAHDAAAMDAQARGMLVHRLLETLDFAADDPLGADDVAAQAGELGIAPTAAECSAIAAVVQAARRTPLAARLAVAGVRRELPFAFSVGPSEVLVTGRLDAVVGADGGPCLVVDYKTDRLRDGEDLEAVVGERYGTQRLIYALAALQAGHSEVEVVHWFLERPREWAHARFSAAQAVDLREGLAHKLAHIQARGYVVSDTPHVALCTGCPGRGTLCSHSLAATFAVRPGELGEAAAPTAPVPNQ